MLSATLWWLSRWCVNKIVFGEPSEGYPGVRCTILSPFWRVWKLAESRVVEGWLTKPVPPSLQTAVQ